MHRSDLADGDNSSSEIGFVNITMWADSANTAEAKIQKYIESLGWHLVSVERAHIVGDGEYGEAELSQIEKTRNNPNAIILGTLHTIKQTKFYDLRKHTP